MNTVIKMLHTVKLYTIAKSIADFLSPLNPFYVRRRKAMKSFYGGFIARGDICYDIGANVGNRTEVFLELGARVIAVEPQRACIEALEKKFGKNPMLTIVSKALGEAEGEAELMVSSATTISSLSKQFVDSVRASGRFSEYRWDAKETVALTTFDRLIEDYGVPAFTKIDVEGFEADVVRGLSQPVGVVSFEFVPEYLKPALDSIGHLARLGAVRFNYSLGETMRLALDRWIPAGEIIAILELLPDRRVFGDVYARFGE